jgi:hypothetical protein
MTSHVDAPSDETHTLTTQAGAMAGKRWEAVRMHNPMERNVLLVAVP